MVSRFYAQGEKAGRKLYAPDYRVFSGATDSRGFLRTARTMSTAERAEYDAGYKAGQSRLTLRDYQRAYE